MAIACQTLLEDAARHLGQGANNSKFIATFVGATNAALDELSLEADLATRLTHIVDVDDSISLDAEYTWIVYAGLIFHLIRRGIRPADPRIAKVLFDDSRVTWDTARAAYVVAEDNDNQSDADNDVWGLGSLT